MPSLILEVHLPNVHLFSKNPATSIGLPDMPAGGLNQACSSEQSLSNVHALQPTILVKKHLLLVHVPTAQASPPVQSVDSVQFMQLSCML